MMLESLVVSRDWQEVSVLECILGGMQIGVQVVTEMEQAERQLSCSKIDALIVDSDLPGTERFLRHLPPYFASNGAPVVMMGRQHRSSSADFTFEKPISVEQAVRTLSAARNRILQGRLRYHREALGLKVVVRYGKHKRLEASIRNVSHGGLGVDMQPTADLQEPLTLRFSLPGKHGVVEATGELAWTNRQGGAGIRFVAVPERSQQRLERWLAQRYFQG
jgi:hypothetical protein